jgi:hypothetical protein
MEGLAKMGTSLEVRSRKSEAEERME